MHTCDVGDVLNILCGEKRADWAKQQQCCDRYVWGVVEWVGKFTFSFGWNGIASLDAGCDFILVFFFDMRMCLSLSSSVAAFFFSHFRLWRRIRAHNIVVWRLSTFFLIYARFASAPRSDNSHHRLLIFHPLVYLPLCTPVCVCVLISAHRHINQISFASFHFISVFPLLTSAFTSKTTREIKRGNGTEKFNFSLMGSHVWRLWFRIIFGRRSFRAFRKRVPVLSFFASARSLIGFQSLSRRAREFIFFFVRCRFDENDEDDDDEAAMCLLNCVCLPCEYGRWKWGKQELKLLGKSTSEQRARVEHRKNLMLINTLATTKLSWKMVQKPFFIRKISVWVFQSLAPSLSL